MSNDSTNGSIFKEKIIMGLLDRMKQNRNKSITALKTATSENNFKNEDEYFPERDSEGNASVVIRFLPQQDPDRVPFVSYYKHIFKGDTGKWVVTDICPTTVGKPCEICQKNGKLFQSGITENQNIARARKRNMFACVPIQIPWYIYYG